MRLPRILRDMLTLPTAAFAESAVLDYICETCRQFRGVRTHFDRHGNLVAHYRYRPDRVTPLVFAAHTDHPGFVAQKMREPRVVAAHFRGWVEAGYFPGARMKFWSEGEWVKGKVLEVTKAIASGVAGRDSRPERVLIRVRRPIAPGAPGMWDLPEPRLRGDRLYAGDCDDIAGCAGQLALLERLSRKRARAEAICLFTRAEEVGFVGAIGAAKSGTIPKHLPIIGIETSKELPAARIGDGPILRVGDRLSIFTPAVTDFCNRVALRLSRRKTFAYQRKLMDGGTCESTAYVAYGYAATGVCLALGNYHNMDTQRRRIAPEYISRADWTRMVDWFEALVLDRHGYNGNNTALRTELDKRFEQHSALLTTDGGA
ncbi:MAG: hypothetical protein KKB50_14675 [Planctomycetes bacterium]|nr:hypothetical protein [Planctomycetota bacterium]